MWRLLTVLLAGLLVASCAPQSRADGVRAAAQEAAAAALDADARSVAPAVPMSTPLEAMTAAQREVCLASGGRVERRGMAGAQVCVRAYADGGNSCIDGSQCQGRCMTEGSMQLPVNGAGICQRDDALFGCFGEVENGRVVGGVCVD